MFLEKLNPFRYPSFTGGIHPAEHKWTKDKSIEVMPAPATVYIPFSQHTGIPAEPLVNKGDRVKIGTKIGEAQGFISSPIHASVSGHVVGIKTHPHPLLGMAQTCVIENDFKDDWAKPPRQSNDLAKISRQQMLDIIREAGVTGQGGGSFPAYAKLSPPAGKTIDTVIINGCECEPMLTADYRLMLEFTSEIIEGALVIRRILEAENMIIAIESNKKEAAARFLACIKDRPIRMRIVRTKYPQGSERQLVKTVVGREIPPGRLPFEVGCVVHNVGTSVCIYQALNYAKPFIDRVITVTGKNVREPKNLLVRLGTRAIDVIDYCGGCKAETAKIIFGGPMMGIAQYSEEVPVIKGTTGIIVMDDQEVQIGDEGPCVRCGRCVDICPEALMPCEIASFVEKNKLERANEYGIFNCIECGACAYVCPTSRMLVHHIRFGKAELETKKADF